MSNLTTVETWLYHILRVFFGIILIYASIEKILYPTQFAQTIENYRMISPLLSRWLAIWLPWLELFLGFMLIVGFWPTEVSYTNAALMLIFYIAVQQAYLRGLDINCGCFAAESGSKVDIAKVCENIVLLISSIYYISLVKRYRLTSLS